MRMENKVNQQHSNIKTALHSAAECQDENKVIELLEQGADVSARDKAGETVFHILARYDMKDLFVKCMERRSDAIRIRDNAGLAPLHTAIQNRSINTASYILTTSSAAQADIRGENAVHYAVQNCPQEVVEQVCQLCPGLIHVPNGEKMTPIMLGVQLNKLDAVKTLFQYQADTTLTNYHGWSTLHLAIDTGHYSMVEWVVDHAHVDINQCDEEGMTPLSLLHSKSRYVLSPDFSRIDTLLLSKGAVMGCTTPGCR